MAHGFGVGAEAAFSGVFRETRALEQREQFVFGMSASGQRAEVALQRHFLLTPFSELA
jgi:hypothetical protein